MAYLKPQIPLESDGDYIYPLTTIDQVINANGEKIILGDYVVETGASNGWHYSKWYSGKAECYKTLSHAITGWSAWGNLFEATPKVSQQSYPSGLFISAPAIMATATSAGIGTSGVEFYKENTTSVTPEFFILRPNNPGSTGTFFVSLYALGRWK